VYSCKSSNTIAALTRYALFHLCRQTVHIMAVLSTQEKADIMSMSLATASINTTVAVWALDDLSHDHGLEHAHHWAREGSAGRLVGPVASDTSSWPTPSSTVHDDVHYGN
jgi:hypothetical protein